MQVQQDHDISEEWKGILRHQYLFNGSPSSCLPSSFLPTIMMSSSANTTSIALQLRPEVYISCCLYSHNGCIYEFNRHFNWLVAWAGKIIVLINPQDMATHQTITTGQLRWKCGSLQTIACKSTIPHTACLGLAACACWYTLMAQILLKQQCTLQPPDRMPACM